MGQSIKRRFETNLKWNFAWGRSNRISLVCGNLIHINVVSPHFPPSVAHTRICSLKLDPLLFIFVAFCFLFLSSTNQKSKLFSIHNKIVYFSNEIQHQLGHTRLRGIFIFTKWKLLNEKKIKLRMNDFFPKKVWQTQS